MYTLEQPLEQQQNLEIAHRAGRFQTILGLLLHTNFMRSSILGRVGGVAAHLNKQTNMPLCSHLRSTGPVAVLV